MRLVLVNFLFMAFNPLALYLTVIIYLSVLSEELECLDEVWGEEESSDGRVTSIELKREQVNAF